MDERILVEVYVPAVQQGMEVLFPHRQNWVLYTALYHDYWRLPGIWKRAV